MWAPGEITSRVIETSIPKIREHADFIFLSDLALSPPPVSKIKFITHI